MSILDKATSLIVYFHPVLIDLVIQCIQNATLVSLPHKPVVQCHLLASHRIYATRHFMIQITMSRNLRRLHWWQILAKEHIILPHRHLYCRLYQNYLRPQVTQKARKPRKMGKKASSAFFTEWICWNFKPKNWFDLCTTSIFYHIKYVVR